MTQYPQWPGFPPPPPPRFGETPAPKPRRHATLVLAICVPILVLTTIAATVGYVIRDDDARDLRHDLDATQADLTTRDDELNRLRASLTSTQTENTRLAELNKALSAPAISMRAWIQKEDAQGRAINIWQTGTPVPTKQDLTNASVYILALVTNTGGQAVDLTWYTIESRRGFSMARAYSDGPKSFYKKVPLRIAPYSQVTVGIDLPTAVLYARRDTAHYEGKLMMLVRFAGLDDYRAEVPFDFNQIPDNWQ